MAMKMTKFMIGLLKDNKELENLTQ